MLEVIKSEKLEKIHEKNHFQPTNNCASLTHQ